jgi:hypothetical protein
MSQGSRRGERRGGRQKGTPNKRKVAVADKLKVLGRDPIEGMRQGLQWMKRSR